MPARIDKYEPNTGGFRAPLGFAIPQADVGKIFAVGLDANGRAVKGAGSTGIKGVVIPSSIMNVGDTIDVGQDLEAVFGSGDTTPAAAGTNIYGVPASGALTTTAAGGVYLGHTVQPWRVVFRVCRPTVVGA